MLLVLSSQSLLRISICQVLFSPIVINERLLAPFPSIYPYLLFIHDRNNKKSSSPPLKCFTAWFTHVISWRTEACMPCMKNTELLRLDDALTSFVKDSLSYPSAWVICPEITPSMYFVRDVMASFFQRALDKQTLMGLILGLRSLTCILWLILYVSYLALMFQCWSTALTLYLVFFFLPRCDRTWSRPNRHKTTSLVRMALKFIPPVYTIVTKKKGHSRHK